MSPHRRIVRHRVRSFDEQDGRCFYCARLMWERTQETVAEASARLGLTRAAARRAMCTAEHLVRRADGGGHGSHNIVAACSGCNVSRGEALPAEWQEARANAP